MRIGIDASRAFVSEPTGTERYSYELITRMVQLPEAEEHEWVLYTRNLAIGNDHLALNSSIARFFKLIDQMPNVKMIHIGLPKLWTQVGLAARTWIDGLDVLWVPAHTLPVLRKPGIKSLVTIHGIEYEWLPAYENKLQRWYLPLSTKYAVASTNKIIAVSDFTKRQLVERLGADERKIEVVYEGYTQANSKSEYRNPKQIQILKQFNLQKKKYIIFVGTVQPRKNLERLFEAFIKIPNTKNQIPIKLVIAGKWGWGCETLFRKFEILNPNDQVNPKEQNIVFTGYISEAERHTLLQNALFYVQPSITEGFGLPVLEAWNAGLAVVSSSGGALRELVTKFQVPNSNDQINSKFKIKKNQAGILFDPYNVEEMTEAMKELIEDGKLREEMEKRGKLRLKDFSWDKAAQETLKQLITV